MAMMSQSENASWMDCIGASPHVWKSSLLWGCGLCQGSKAHKAGVVLKSGMRHLSATVPPTLRQQAMSLRREQPRRSDGVTNNQRLAYNFCIVKSSNVCAKHLPVLQRGLTADRLSSSLGIRGEISKKLHEGANLRRVHDFA